MVNSMLYISLILFPTLELNQVCLFHSMQPGGPMRVSMIAALAKNRVIGNKNDLPWYLPADMRHFMNTTMGKPIVMGRKTFQSLGGKPLTGRSNIILSRDPKLKPFGCSVFATPEAVLEAYKTETELMIIGGAAVYGVFLPRADRLYLTLIDSEIAGDSYFPEYQQLNWRETERRQHDRDEKNKYNFSFVTLERHI